MAPLVVVFALAGGVALGLLVGWLWSARSRIAPFDAIPNPTLVPTCLSDGRLQIDWAITGLPMGVELVALHVKAYDDETTTPLPSPDGGAATYPNPVSPIFYTLPPMPMGGFDRLIVWAEYRIYGCTAQTYRSCPVSGSSGSSSMRGMMQPLSAVATEQLEAVPRAYRVSPGAPLAGAGGGPAADLVGALSREREALLEYAPDASTPVEPVWQARGGPGPVVRWSLGLFHGRGGLGAVLTVVVVVGGRETRFTWVTSDWRPHAANRLAPEADEPGVPALLVRPA